MVPPGSLVFQGAAFSLMQQQQQQLKQQTHSTEKSNMYIKTQPWIGAAGESPGLQASKVSSQPCQSGEKFICLKDFSRWFLKCSAPVRMLGLKKKGGGWFKQRWIVIHVIHENICTEMQDFCIILRYVVTCPSLLA